MTKTRRPWRQEVVGRPRGGVWARSNAQGSEREVKTVVVGEENQDGCKRSRVEKEEKSGRSRVGVD
jgi:hypothetical protein